MTATIHGLSLFGTGEGLSHYGVGVLQKVDRNFFEFGPYLSGLSPSGVPLAPDARRFYFSSTSVDGKPATIVALVDKFRDYGSREGFVGSSAVISGEIRSAQQVPTELASWMHEAVDAVKQSSATHSNPPGVSYAGSAWEDDARRTRSQTSYAEQLLSNQHFPPAHIGQLNDWKRGEDVPIRTLGRHQSHDNAHRPAASPDKAVAPHGTHVQAGPDSHPVMPGAPLGRNGGRLAAIGTVGAALAGVLFSPTAEARPSREDVRYAFGANITDAVAIAGSMNPSHDTLTGEIFHAVNRTALGASRSLYDVLFETKIKPAGKRWPDTGPKIPSSP